MHGRGRRFDRCRFGLGGWCFRQVGGLGGGYGRTRGQEGHSGGPQE